MCPHWRAGAGGVGKSKAMIERAKSKCALAVAPRQLRQLRQTPDGAMACRALSMSPGHARQPPKSDSPQLWQI
jgi:hypothetical protein